MSTNAAQIEFDDLFRDKGKSNRHPEDEHSAGEDSQHSQEHYFEQDDNPEDDDDEDINDERPSRNMRSRYYLPSLQSNANTGPKGVIADAQAFEHAKRSRRLSFLRLKETNPDLHPAYPTSKDVFPSEEKSSDEEGEESFLSRWRQNRLRELQEVSKRIRSRSRNASPSKRIYGNLPIVDGDGYLDAIEKVPGDTTVVVFIYDDLVCIRSSSPINDIFRCSQ
jgi:hypothetical protein